MNERKKFIVEVYISLVYKKVKSYCWENAAFFEPNAGAETIAIFRVKKWKDGK